MVEKVKPEITETLFGGDIQLTQNHPAYGIIAVSHPQGGGTELFGSNLRHNNRVCLTISLGEQNTLHGHTEQRAKSRGTILELEMTEYQWAQFVSSHSGRGTPVTLRYLRGQGALPRIAEQDSTFEVEHQELRTTLKKMINSSNEGLEELGALLAKGKANKGELSQVYAKLTEFNRKLPDVVSFASEMFEENAEKIVAKSKVEIEAALNAIVVQTGMEALGLKQQLLPPTEENE